MEHSLTIPQKVKYKIPCNSKSPLSIYPREMKIGTYMNPYDLTSAKQPQNRIKLSSATCAIKNSVSSSKRIDLNDISKSVLELFLQLEIPFP